MSEFTSPDQRDAQDDNEFPGGRKKNNKLGYQRTSVACSHCRRRKIRCQPNETDPSGPCVNCQRMKKECLTVPVQEPPPGETDKPRLKAADTSSSISTTVPRLTQSRSSQSSSKVDDLSRPQVPQLPHESSYDNVPIQRPQVAPYQGPISPTTYLLNDHSSTAWSSPASAFQTAAITPLPSQEPSYYPQQPVAQYIPSASPIYDHSQHAIRHYPQSYAGATAHSGSYSVSSAPSGSTSYAGYQPQSGYPPMSAGPQYDGLRRTVTMPHPSSTGLQANDPAYAHDMGYPGQTGLGMNAPHHSTQEQYDAWHQYNEQQQQTSYHDQQQGYGQNPWG